MLMSPFNPLLPSALSAERIEHLNYLAKQAFASADYTPSRDANYKNDLVIEACALQDVLEEVSEAGTYLKFYENIDEAFKLLLEARPTKSVSTFKTYQQLTTLFRVIEREKTIINQKWQEMAQILRDIDVLEREESTRRKGGPIC